MTPATAQTTHATARHAEKKRDGDLFAGAIFRKEFSAFAIFKEAKSPFLLIVHCRAICGVLSLLTLLGGCGSEPFQQPALPVLHNPDPAAIRINFPKLLPDEFTTDDTLILQFPFHDDLVMLGVLNVNKPAGTFELYALNQMGVPFFHVGGDRSNVSIRDAIEPWMQHKDILLAIARDVQHIYFNPAPDASASADIASTHVDFHQKSAEGSLTYQFGMEPAVLLQKQLDGFFGPAWRARYYAYHPGAGGKLFPTGIVMDNSAFHYRLIIKNRDWSIDGKE